MAQKPVKFLSDALFRRNITKEDASGNKLFEVSGTLATGAVSVYAPLSASNAYFAGDVGVSGTLSATKLNITEVNTSVIYETSLSASINALLDVSASNAVNDDLLKYRDGYWIPGTVDLAGAVEATKNAVNRLKFKHIGNFNSSGSAEVYLPLTQLGGAAFPPESIDYIMYDVAIRDEGEWRKHIVYSQLSVKNSQLCVMIDAPALNETSEYKLLSVNTNPDDYIL